MSENEPGPQKAGAAPEKFMWLAWGLGSAIILSGLTLTRMIIAKSRAAVFDVMDQPHRETFTWPQIIRITVVVFVMGFICGLIICATKRLSKEFGALGDMIIGAIVLNALAYMGIVVFDPDVLTRGWFILLRLTGIAAVLGSLFGFLLGREMRKALAEEQAGTLKPKPLEE